MKQSNNNQSAIAVKYFIDNFSIDLTTGQFLNSLVTGEMPALKNVQFNHEDIRNRYKEVSESMKKKYIIQAINNAKSLKKIKEWFASRFIYIFSSLNGHTIENLNLNIK